MGYEKKSQRSDAYFSMRKASSLGILTSKDIVRGLEDDIVGKLGGASRFWQEVVGPELRRQA